MQRFIHLIHFSWKVFWNSDSGMPFQKMWTAFALGCPNWTDDPAVISYELETARNQRGQIQDYRGRGCCITSICLLASQASTILAQCGWALSWCKIHRCFNYGLFIQICRCNCCSGPQYIHHIDFHFLRNCVLINGSSTVEKNRVWSCRCTRPLVPMWNVYECVCNSVIFPSYQYKMEK